MRVLLVAHNFLPAHAAGTEIYTAQLGEHLARRGHAVQVFTSDKDVSLPDFSVREREWRGLPVTEVINNLYYDSFQRTWECPQVESAFERLLDRYQPEVVHFQHLLYLSIGCVEAAARRNLAVLFTLHDFWLHCARMGQRLHADGSLCERIDFARCGACLTSFKFAQSPLERATGRVLAGVRRSTGVDLSAAAKRAARMFAAPRAVPAELDAERAAELAGQVAERDRAFRERVVPHVFRFLSPSRFLRARFVEWGIPAERIQFNRTGIDLERLGSARRERAAGSGAPPLCVAFVGTITRNKGCHVLLDAWGLLDPALRRRARLDIIGSTRHDQDYQRDIARRAGEVGARLRGALPREQVNAALCELDLLVVPSTWYENSPLVIHEAVAARTPVLVSNIGGMAELVDDGASGASFPVGDAGALARSLAGFIERPERLTAFYSGSRAIKSVEEDAAQVEQVYMDALADVRARAARGEGARG